MTTEEFVTALTACAPRYVWRIEARSGFLRGYATPPCGEREAYCPITAVAQTHAAARWEVSDWDRAAKTIGLPLAAAAVLVQAADEESLDESLALRARLLTAVGL